MYAEYVELYYKYIIEYSCMCVHVCVYVCIYSYIMFQFRKDRVRTKMGYIFSIQTYSKIVTIFSITYYYLLSLIIKHGMSKFKVHISHILHKSNL